MKTLTVLDVVGAIAALFVVFMLAGWLRDLGIHRPKRRGNPPAPRPTKIDTSAELAPVTVCGSWPINKGDRVRILVAVPEYSIEIGHEAVCEDVWPGDDVMYRFKLAGRHGRDAIITFLESELWQLERIPA